MEKVYLLSFFVCTVYVVSVFSYIYYQYGEKE